MERRITLTDIDRPGEALEVDIIAADETSLTLAVPNTSVQFRLFRHSCQAPYQGSLGGRVFYYVPLAVEGKMATVKARSERTA
ncbi:hypothetical protein C5688_20950 [Methylocystis sp. MitZ-2018]|nr:hypothetical protein C5688_20950 [Methylocystis sp. MitZ-2018]